MYISANEWQAFVRKLSAINMQAGNAVKEYINKYGLDDVQSLVRYCYQTANYYGTASAALSALMYDTVGELEGLALKAAEMAPGPDYGDVAKAVQGTLKTSQNVEEIAGSVSRLVKRTGQDTMLFNGIRDGAEFAWIPTSDTCAFCIALASRGWQSISKKALKNGHASHIHSNCDCTYMVRHTSNLDIKGYEPEKYLETYNNAGGRSSKEKINAMRRANYAENKDAINAQKREAYAQRMRPKEGQ